MSGIGGGLGLYRTQFEIYSFAATRAAADELDEIINEQRRQGNALREHLEWHLEKEK